MIHPVLKRWGMKVAKGPIMGWRTIAVMDQNDGKTFPQALWSYWWTWIVEVG